MFHLLSYRFKMYFRNIMLNENQIFVSYVISSAWEQFFYSRTMTTLPDDTTVLLHQVAGHFHGKGKHKLGMLKHKDGSILKPVIQEDIRGPREKAFYTKVFDAFCSDPVFLQLQSFLPKYRGCWITQFNSTKVEYMCLEDITDAFHKPCILDLKIGPRTFDPEAKPQKIKIETEKYPAGKIIGFRILGMRVFQPDRQEYLVLDRNFGKQQTPDTIPQALKLFLNIPDRPKAWLLLCFLLHKLHSIKSWFLHQRHFVFYGSSLLLVYEGDTEKRIGCEKTMNSNFSCEQSKDSFGSKITSENNDSVTDYCSICCLSSNLCKSVLLDSTLSFVCDVRMIDFAHVFTAHEKDTNYLVGLDSLITYLYNIQNSLLHDMQ
ncbi:inositol polyphosphate multikinase-like isoform X1 [Limulus polyphemus]|uniref:Kinase n=2 Tax=Limulus polyphemus TaxID=6850 RepID=A0ABM1TF35_LIMPO|nr:inositol polyphosphate multikinase-like isoform X1 [Limulus polyphemus]